MNRTLAVTALTLVSLAGVALGQQARVPGSPQPLPAEAAANLNAVRSNRENEAREVLAMIARQNPVTINFPGGTVSEYIEHVKKAAKTPINVVVSPSVSGAVLSEIQLKDVPVDAAISAIQTASGERTYNWQIRPLVGLNGGGSTVPNAYSVDGEKRVPSSSNLDTSRSSPGVQVLTLQAGGGDSVKPEVALAAIEAGLKASQTKGTPNAEVSFHKESGLLFVNGSFEQCELVKLVVSAFKSKAAEAESAPWLAVIKDARILLAAKTPADFMGKLEEVVKLSANFGQAENGWKMSLIAQQEATELLKRQWDHHESQVANDRKELVEMHQAELADMKVQYRDLEKKYLGLMDQIAMFEAKARATRENPPADNVKR